MVTILDDDVVIRGEKGTFELKACGEQSQSENPTGRRGLSR